MFIIWNPTTQENIIASSLTVIHIPKCKLFKVTSVIRNDDWTSATLFSMVQTSSVLLFRHTPPNNLSASNRAILDDSKATFRLSFTWKHENGIHEWLPEYRLMTEREKINFKCIVQNKSLSLLGLWGSGEITMMAISSSFSLILLFQFQLSAYKYLIKPARYQKKL